MTAAITANDGSGSPTVIFTADTNSGSIVDQVNFLAAQATTALTSTKVGKLFYDVGNLGTTASTYLLGQVVMAAETPSTTV